MQDTPKEESTVLPPKNNHHTDRQPNGSAQRMAAPYDTEPTLSGLAQSSARLLDDVANGVLEVRQAQAANASVSNGISSIKTQVSLLRAVDTMKDPSLMRVAADMMGGAATQRFHGLADARDKQRQIAADRQSGAQGDKSTEG